MKKFLDIIKDSLLWQHIALMLGVFVVLLLSVSMLLGVYISHGEKMPVPDFVGLNLEKAEEIAQVVNLNIKLIDSVFSSDKEPGEIISHSPAAGYNVKGGRTVFVVVNSSSPEIIKMPDLLNTSLRQAKEIIKVYGLELGKISYSPDFAQNYVLAQHFKGRAIKKGALIAKRSQIDLVLGLGDSGKDVLMPKLVGISYEEAVSIIRSRKLLLGGSMFPGQKLNSEDSLNAIVMRQSPEFEDGKFVKTGTLVDIWMKAKQSSENSDLDELTK